MYIMYVDESGDPGIYTGYNSKHFFLSGLIINQEDWLRDLEHLKTLRKSLKDEYGLNLKEEIHASELIRIDKIKVYRKIKKVDRLEIFKKYIQQIPIIFNNAKLINICFDKTEFETTIDIQERSWTRLIQRFDTFLKRSVMDKGIIISDDTDEPLIRKHLRRMRVYNPISSHFGGSYNAPTDNIIEDAFLRNSKHSYFIQTVDLIVHSLYRKEFPKGSLKKYNIHEYFNYLKSILLIEASPKDEFGIVRK